LEPTALLSITFNPAFSQQGGDIAQRERAVPMKAAKNALSLLVVPAKSIANTRPPGLRTRRISRAHSARDVRA